MQYKSYPNKKTTASRMARKHERQTVFLFNRKAAKLRRKAAKVARQENEANNQ